MVKTIQKYKKAVCFQRSVEDFGFSAACVVDV